MVPAESMTEHDGADLAHGPTRDAARDGDALAHSPVKKWRDGAHFSYGPVSDGEV